ncbi:MAG: zinc ribbon domain-containing protein [Ruminococcaceae bacterium]|nr:zinc ribbon domain-containing protein [Oscillospiraceae bacterium]
MFCPHCGREMAVKTAFCTNCGKSLEILVAAPAAAPAPQLSMRESEIQLMQRTVDYFKQKEALYQEYDRTCAQVFKDAEGPSAGFIVWSIILSIVSVIFIYVGLFTYPAEGSHIGLGLGITGFLLAIGLIVIRNIKAAKCRDLLANSVNRYWSIYNELQAHYRAYPNCPVGMELTNPEILTVILHNLQSGRHDNIQGALMRVIRDADDDDLEDFVDDLGDIVLPGHAPKKTALFYTAKLFD